METTTDTHGINDQGWYGFDLDGTLAVYNGWQGIDHIGEPVKPMVDLIKRMHDEGKIVKIMTARVARKGETETCPNPYFTDGVPDYVRQNSSTLKYLYYSRFWTAKIFIMDWCLKNLGFIPEITHQKDGSMIELYDDRVKQVVPNEGILVEEKVKELEKLLSLPDNNWEEKCRRCNENGLDDREECEFYGEPCGCNSFIYGKHPAAIYGQSQPKNSAVMREALEKIVKQALAYSFFDGKLPASNEEFESKIIDEAPKYVLLRDDWMEAIELARAALAVKPRNCDVGSPKEQYKRFFDWCFNKQCYNCQFYPYRNNSQILCFSSWAQLPYSDDEHSTTQRA